MEKTYGSSTEDYLRNIPVKTETNKILKQIAQNLAYIAEELSQGSEERHKIGNDVFCVRDFLECDLGPIIHGSHNSNDNDSEGEILGKCFICGKEIELKDGCYDDGGCIITSDGDLFLACPKCKKRFDALIQHFVMPNEVFC